MTNEEAKRRLEVWLKCMDCPEDKQCYDSHLHSTCEYTDYCDETPVSEAVKVAIKALEQQPSDTVSRGAFEQVMWERDVAIEQLKELGYELGQKIEHCDDAISRNAVIQALNKMDRYTATELTLCDTNKKFPANEVFIVDDVYEQIAEQLPSVTHKPIECDDAINRPRVVKFEGTNMACMGGDEIMKEFENNPQQNNDKATCDDAISRQAVLDYLKANVDDFPDYHEAIEKVLQMSSVTQKSGKCKNCKYFEYDSVAKVDGMPLIVAHEVCNKWGGGCKTKEDGYCYLFEPQESEDKE